MSENNREQKKPPQVSIRAEGVVPVFANSFEILDGDAAVRLNFGVSELSENEEDDFFLCTAAVGMTVTVAKKLHQALGECLGLVKKEVIQ